MSKKEFTPQPEATQHDFIPDPVPGLTVDWIPDGSGEVIWPKKNVKINIPGENHETIQSNS